MRGKPHYLACRLIAAGLFVLGLTAMVGCSSKGSLSGKVTFKNEPVPKGTRIVFLHVKSDRTVQADIHGDDGSYTCDNVPTGECKIAVQPSSAPSVGGQIAGATGGKDKKMGIGPPKDAPVGFNPYGVLDKGSEARKGSVNIPDKYRDPKTSELTVTVKGGKQEHSFTVPDN